MGVTFEPNAATLGTPHTENPLLRVEGIAKAFGSTRALTACSLNVLPGEVHAVIGENGSGKSTLVKVLSGVHRPDQGRIGFDGRAVDGFRSPHEPLAAGLHAVFQEVLVVGPQSVLENVWMGADQLFRRRIPEHVKHATARAVLTELLGRCPPLDTPVERLSLSDRQACGIARALVRDPKLLILDEATSALDIATRDRLFAILRQLVVRGRSVIFISHRMDEIEELAHRVTILRNGESVGTRVCADTSSPELVRLMAGHDHQLDERAHIAHASTRVRDEIVLRTQSLRISENAPPIDFALRAGEIVGLAGLEGHGQDELLRALWGQRVAAGEVMRVSDGAEAVLRSPAEAAELGVAYVPRDRRISLFPSLSIRENFAGPTAGLDRRWGLLRRGLADARLAVYRQQIAIKLSSGGAAITTLSGGNQQKVVIARWLALKPRILLLNDPTRGVDISAKRDIYALVTSLAADGVAVVILSTELEEHVELMDRVLVFRERGVFAELARSEISREALVESYFGRRSQ